MSRRLAAWSLLLLSLAGGCPSECQSESYYVTDSGLWRLTASQLRTDPCDLPGTEGHQQDEPLLVGTRWCPDFACEKEPTCVDEIRTECYEASVEGPGQTDGACLNVTGSGELVWRFDPLPCDHPGLFFPEQLRLRSVDASAVRGRLVPYLDTMALDNLVSGTGAFPLDIMPPPDAPLLKLAADEPVQLAVNLWAGERRVAWSDDQASLEVEVLTGTAPVVAFGDAAATVRLQVPAGSEATLSLVVGADRIPLGSVRGVAHDALAELELVVAYQNDLANSSSQTPFGARAVARDGDGDLVYGAPAEWKVLAGSFAFTRPAFLSEGANYDYTALYDNEADGDKKESSLCFDSRRHLRNGACTGNR